MQPAQKGAWAHAIRCRQAIAKQSAERGRSRGGLTSKIHAVVDALGNPIRFIITPGHWGDSPQARRLVEGLDGVGHVIADTAYDANHFRRFIDQELGASAEIPSNPARAGKLPIDLDLYKARHLVQSRHNTGSSR